MPASHESPAGTAPSVLLVEEYDALAAAIASALKKFAPGHRIHVVESLGDAAGKAREINPQLFIVDLDPPQADAIEALTAISAEHPSARFLAIASGVPTELGPARYGPSAIQFIDKPFELAEFGAAVQALLGPWTNATSGDSRGTLLDLNLRDLIPLQCLNLATAVLHLRTADDRAGEVHFLDGHIIHAAAGNFTGAGALFQMLRWKNPRAHETERVIEAPRTIHGAWMPVFLEVLRQAKEIPEPSVPAPTPAPPTPPARQEPPKPRAKTGKKVVVIDDTEMLLIFVEDVLATAEPTLQIVTAFTGSEGVRRTEVMLPDLVLLDYSLPDLRGDQVCERLLRNEATSRIPIVMMSGHVSEMETTGRKYRNVVATLAKPFMSDTLVTLVKETLAKGPLPITAPEPLRVPATPAGNGEKRAKKNGATAAKEAPEKIAPPVVEPRPVEGAPSPPPPVVAPVPAPVSPPPPPPAAPPQPKPMLEPMSPTILPVPVPAAPAPPPARRPTIISALAASNGSTVVVGLGVEVIAMQFTPALRIGGMRARPTAASLFLAHPSAPAENLLSGFEIGSVELDTHGRIESMRVLPTRQPGHMIRPRNALLINQLALTNQTAPIELTAGPSAPMTMQLAALFKVAGVELSDRFEVSQLVLRPSAHRVRVNLDPQARIAAGTEFETAQVRLDASRRIAEFVLNIPTN